MSRHSRHHRSQNSSRCAPRRATPPWGFWEACSVITELVVSSVFALRRVASVAPVKACLALPGIVAVRYNAGYRLCCFSRRLAQERNPDLSRHTRSWLAAQWLRIRLLHRSTEEHLSRGLGFVPTRHNVGYRLCCFSWRLTQNHRKGTLPNSYRCRRLPCVVDNPL
jgi:hypothetical protein